MRAGRVAFDDSSAPIVDAVGRRHPDRLPRLMKYVPDHARDSGLAVRARDGNDGDASVISRRVDQLDDGAAHVTRLALARVQVHTQARRGVELDDSAAGTPD